MSTERNKLTLNSRRTRTQPNALLNADESGNTTVNVARGPSMDEPLTHLLSFKDNDGDIPAARLKSTDSTYNAAGARVVLIRRNPFAETGEYEPAATNAGAKALKQWVNAGLSDQYPEEYRVFSERDLIRTVNETARQENKDSRNAWSRYTTVNTRFTEEIKPQFAPDTREYRKAQWSIDNCIREVDTLHEAAGMNRLARITSLVKDGYTITPAGIASARAAQMLALIDSLPMSQTRWINADLRTELAVSITTMTPVSTLMLGKLKEAKLDWQVAEDEETLFTWKRLMWIADELL